MFDKVNYTYNIAITMLVQLKMSYWGHLRSNVHSYQYILSTSVAGNGDHFVYAPTQWGTMLQSNIVSHWLGTYTKWSLGYQQII